MKKIVDVLRSQGNHWVGDGFPVVHARVIR